jgi:hypothetical protein
VEEAKEEQKEMNEVDSEQGCELDQVKLFVNKLGSWQLLK